MSVFDGAKWIWNKSADAENAHVNFYFDLNIPDDECTVRLSVESDYALYADGELVSFGQFADYPFDKVYDEIAVPADLLGKNVSFRVECWHQGVDSSTRRNEQAGLIFEVCTGDGVILSSGRSVLSCVDPAFRSGKMENVSGQLGVTFAYDASKALPPRPDRLTPSDEVEKPLPKRQRPVKKLVLGEDEPAVLTVSGSFTLKRDGTSAEKMQYASMTFGCSDIERKLPSADGIFVEAGDGEDGVFVIIDTGRENAGLLSLDLDLPEQCEVLVGWGEHLEDLRVRAFVGGRNFCGSYNGVKGRNRFLNPFRRLGMRYLQLNILAPSATVYYAGIRTTDYPFAKGSEFTCADNLHNKIYEVCKRTLLLSVHEHYEDCPWREQALYAMDSRNQMLCGYYAFGETDMPAASIRLMAESLRPDGILELCSPARVPITIPAFSAMFLTQVYEYCQYSGSLELADEIRDVLIRVGDEFVTRIEENGMIKPFEGDPYWNFYEWQEGLEGWGSMSSSWSCHAPLMAFASLGLRSLGETLALLGADGEKYINAHKKLNIALNEFFLDRDKGVYASHIDKNVGKVHYAELTNALCVCCGAAEGEALESVLKALKSGELIGVTLSHSIFKYEALMSDPEKNARYVFADIAAKWGSMLYRNATTFWETIDGAPAFDNAGSLCHGWSAIPVYFYHRYAAVMDGSVTGLYECRIEKGE